MDADNSLKIFKCLSDTSRIHILQSLMTGETYTELLAQRLNISPSTVSFHMKKLEDAGLVSSRKEQYYTVYSLNPALLDRSLSDILKNAAQDNGEEKREEAYRKKVLASFFEYGKLKTIPVQRKKKVICLEEIAKKFEIGREYEEKELSDMIFEVHEDYCTIRRDMISEGIFRRDGNIYVRVK